MNDYLNKIICGDCIKIMGDMPKESVDIIVTSPPYNIGVKYNSHDDNMPFEDYLNWMDVFAKKCYDVLSTDGSLFFNMGDRPSDELRTFKVANIINKYFRLQNTIVWVKSISIPEEKIAVGHYKPVNSDRFLNHCYEYIFQFTKTNNKKIDKLSIGVPYQHKSNVSRWGAKEDKRDRGDVWYIPYETVKSEKLHPAMFPLKLPEMCIKLHGYNKKTIVLDPFIGSGTTALSAKRLGCNYIGIDIDQKYCNIAKELLFQEKII